VNMKSAAFNDRCSKCGDVIPDNAGCIQVRDYLCDDCCKAAGHQHPWLKPRKEGTSTMQSYIKQFISGLFGRFRRNADGSVECLGLALDTDGKAMKKMANAVGRETEIVRAASAPTADNLVSAGYDAARAAYRDAIDRGDSEAASRATEAIRRLRRAAAQAGAPVRVEPETFVTKTCIYPGCNQQFETSGSRLMCDEHVHRPEPDPKVELAPVAYRLHKPLGRPTEAGPDSNPSRGDTLSHFVPEVSPLQQARDAYAEALALGDSAACSEAMERITRLTRAAAAPSPGMLKRIVPDSFAGLSGDAGLLQRGKPFVERTCDRCGADFQTRSERKTCDECLTKPRRMT